ncbi:BTAD domain-containing putative transcriptional regulator [Kitasatospora sp. NPDC004272]
MKVEARLLGPVALTVDGAPLGIASAKVRTLLAELLAAPGQAVSVQRLVTSLWGDSPPPSASSTLHAYVSRLRSALRSAGAGSPPLRSRSGHYLLEITPSSVDAVRFRAAVEDGRRKLAAGQPGPARDGLDEALSLWCGPALTGIRTNGPLEAFRRALEELQLEARALRIKADLLLGAGAVAIPELRALVSEHPEHPGLREQLARAFADSGRTSDAWALASALMQEPEPATAGPGTALRDAVLPEQDPTAASRPTGPQELRISLLGPVRAWRGATELAIGSPQQRAVLAMLAANPGRVLPVAELVYGLWGSSEPPQAVAAIRTYVSRLRAALDHGRPDNVLASVSDGYLLRLPEGAVDIGVFRRMRSDASRATTDGDLERAVRTGAAGLALWRGPRALEGVPGFFSENLASQLAEQRITLLEDLFAGRIALGRGADSIGELQELATEQPLRERTHELLMTALYRAGRSAEALAVYRRARRLLSTELGVDPGPRLSELHQRILAHDPGLLTGTTASGTTGPHPPRVPRPAQLPPETADFIGREHLFQDLLDSLRNGPSHTVAVTALTGPPGAGKTALALRTAHALRPEFPDGQLFARLQGGSVDSSAVLHDFLTALGVDRPPDGREQRTAMFRSLLAGRRVLIVLDDAADRRQVEPLIPGTPGSAVLITGRSAEVAPLGTRALRVPHLTPSEGVELLAALVGRERVAAEHSTARALVIAGGLLPFSIRLSASFLHRHPEWPLANLLDRMHLGRAAPDATVDRGTPDDPDVLVPRNGRDAAEDPRPTTPGKPIRSWRPHELGIHPASAKSARTLTSYVRRAHDEALATVVREAAHGTSGMAVLVGSAATGKSRACWEAVQPLVDLGWRLWQPPEPLSADSLLPELGNIAPRTVVWLDEAQRCLPLTMAGARVAVALRSLVERADRAPVLVLGTLWPEYAARCTAQPLPGGHDPGAPVRDLLGNRLVPVPDSFDAAAHRAARSKAAAGDVLLMDALAHNLDHGRLAQYLSGGLELTRHYEQASPAARALLRAAMDARRLGVGLLPQSFLTDAAVDYLSDPDWERLDDNWAEAAFADLTRPVRGGSAPLRRATPRPLRRPSGPRPAHRTPPSSTGPLYRLAGLLEQHGRLEYRGSCPPASFWNAAYDHLAHPEDRRSLERAARIRHRLQWAHHLSPQDAPDETDLDPNTPLPAIRLARQQEASANWARAEELFRQAANAGDPSALPGLTRLRLVAGDRSGAEELYRRALDTGEDHALACLALIQDMAGDLVGAESLALRASDSGNFSVFAEIALARAADGDRTGAERLARTALDAGDASGILTAYRQQTWPDGLDPDGSATPAWR